MKALRWWHGRRRYWEAGVELGYRLGKEAGEGEAMTAAPTDWIENPDGLIKCPRCYPKARTA